MMREFERVDAKDAVREASECCERIASAIEETTHEAEQLDDPQLVNRLAAAKAAADRARVLIAKLAGLIEADQPNVRQASN